MTAEYKEKMIENLQHIMHKAGRVRALTALLDAAAKSGTAVSAGVISRFSEVLEDEAFDIESDLDALCVGVMMHQSAPAADDAETEAAADED